MLKNRNKGITLIALVITIIILLILAGISISALINQGLFKNAKAAQNATEKAEVEQEKVLNEYEEEINKYLSNNDIVEEKEIKASDIASAEDKNEYYGKRVEYTPMNGATVANWKIFYADENNIYLIADDYVETKYLPNATNVKGETTKNKPSIDDNEYARSAYFGSDLLADYSTGSARITDLKIKTLNNSFFSQSFTSTNDNMKAVAYMLDTKAWEGFKDAKGKAEYAIGGPTIEMIFKSYNQKHNANYKTQATSEMGYQVKVNGDSWKDYTDVSSEEFDVKDKLYVINDLANARAMWVASPSATSHVMIIHYDGKVLYTTYANIFIGFRPLICLNSNVRLLESENGYIIK